MEYAMTDRDAHLGEGERAERRRSRRFWAAMSVTAILGMPLGFFLGQSAARNGGSMTEAFTALPPIAVVALLALAVAGLTLTCWYFLKSVDEVEILDNLWGSTAGFYVYMVLFPVWWALWKTDLVGEPNDWIILGASFAAGTLAYLARKWRSR